MVDSFSSPKSDVLSGVPQGSILGPLLFILYINDLCKIDLPASSSLTLYADDILLTHIISDPVIQSFSSIQSSVNSISSWLSSNYLSLNINKTKCMTISRRSISTPPLYILNKPIQPTGSYTYLGVIISSTLSWSPHITHICSKARKLIAMIYRTFCPHASSTTLIKLYKSIILPHLTYCSSIWSPPPNSGDAALLERTQKFALRVCSGDWGLGYKPLLSRFSILPLSSLGWFYKLVLLYKLINNLVYCPLIKSLVNFKSSSPYHIRSLDHLSIVIPYCKTKCFFVSFLPSVINSWNSLPFHIRSSPSLSSFKYLLYHLLSNPSMYNLSNVIS